MKKIKVILPLIDIPQGAVISRINGSYTYKIIDNLEVYNEKGEKRILNSSAGTRFLMNCERPDNIISVASTDEVIWETTFDKLREIFDFDEI